MRKTIAAVLLAVACSGCATFEQAATSPNTFAACKTADVATTAYALHTGRFVESNNFLTWLGGAHGVIPAAALVGFAAWWIVKEYAPPAGVAAANVVTCGAAGHNAWLIFK